MLHIYYNTLQTQFLILQVTTTYFYLKHGYIENHD